MTPEDRAQFVADIASAFAKSALSDEELRRVVASIGSGYGVFTVH